MFDHHQAAGRSALRVLTRGLVGEMRLARNQPLPRLRDVHPGPMAGGRWVGVRTVPTECIRGTASSATSRDQEFRPLRGRASADWKSRWSRLTSGADNQAILPPVDLLRAGGDYWVVDGHNRVALARERGQIWIDADVTELDLGAESVAAAAAKEN